MIKTVFIFFITGFLINSSDGQIEKFHIHTDKEVYYKGETIWFAAYLKSDETPTVKSTRLIIELLDEQGKKLQQKTAPVMYGGANGSFDIPDSSGSAKLFLRAYTAFSLLHDSSAGFIKTVFINQLKPAPVAIIEKTVSLQFFPEGGNFVPGVMNHLAFKATLNNGQPFAIAAAIKNNNGKFIDSISPQHNGMGDFLLIPNPEENYAAIWVDNRGRTITTPLPNYTPNTVTLRLQQNEKALFYQIQNPNPVDERKEITVRISQQNKTVYSQSVLFKSSHEFTGMVPKDSFATGIIQITAYNSHDQPIAERIAFINNQDYKINAGLEILRSSLDKPGLLELKLETLDTGTISLFSVSVSDADINMQGPGRNIYSDLFLGNDVKGYIYQADWYFAEPSAKKMEALDLVMQTHGWRRYTYENNKPVPNNNYITLQGLLTDNNNHPVAGEMVVMIIQTKDSVKKVYTEITDEHGYFTRPNLIFYDDATVYFKHNDSKNKNRKIQFITWPSIQVNGWDNEIGGEEQDVAEIAAATQFTESLKKYDPAFSTREKLLKEVVVTAKRKTRSEQIQELEKTYASRGFFLGNASATQLDVLNDSMAWTSLDAIEYISHRIPGGGTTYSSKVGVGKSLTVFVDMQKVIPSVYIDEHESDMEELQKLQVEDIAYVKYFKNLYVLRLGPTVSIYLKKGKDKEDAYRNSSSLLSTVRVAGFSPMKEFYSPDYSNPVEDKNSDIRNTLYWKPVILLDKTNKKETIRFYNNDFSRRVKVIVEGMDGEGRLIYLEKIIE